MCPVLLQRRLTPDLLHKLANRLTSKKEVRDVGLKLVSDHQVEAALVDEEHIVDAAYKILRDWFNTQGDDVQSWLKLVRVLDEAGLHRYAVEILGAEPN